MVTIIGYDDKNCILFDYCKQCMPEAQFGMKYSGFVQRTQIPTARVFMFSKIIHLFSRILLNHANMKNFSIPGYMKA